MANTTNIFIGNLLYKNSFPLYRPLYYFYKNIQDKFEISLIKAIIKSDNTVFDIGANIGFYTEIFSDLARNGSVHAFEPDVINFSHLKKYYGNKINVQLHQKAVSNKTELIKIYTSKMLNVDHRTYPISEYETSYNVNAISIDDYVNGKFNVDFIKMDIQGNEYFAICGMQETIKKCKPIILTEFWPCGLRQSGASPNKFLRLIESIDYSILHLHNNKIIEFDRDIIPDLEKKGDIGYTNLLLYHKDKEEQMKVCLKG